MASKTLQTESRHDHIKCSISLNYPMDKTGIDPEGHEYPLYSPKAPAIVLQSFGYLLKQYTI